MKIFISIVFFVLASGQAWSLTLSQVYSEIRRNINDNSTDSSRYRYADSTLLGLVNAGQREVVNATWLSEKTTTYQLVSNTTFYSLPNDYIAAIKVEYSETNGKFLELQETSLKKLFNGQVSWRSAQGPPVEYYISQANISSPSLSSLNISYIPVITRTSTGTVSVQYFSQVADLASGSDIPFDGKKHLYPYHEVLVDYVTARIKAIEMKLPDSQAYFQLYLSGLNAMRARLGSMPNYTPSMQVQSSQ